MKPSDLYRLKPIEIDYCLYALKGVIDEPVWNTYNDPNKRVELHSYFFHSFDSDRYMHLFAVKMDNKFVMIIQRAGREGNDYIEYFITDFRQYIQLCKYIRGLNLEYDEKHQEHIYKENKIIKEIGNFYGHNINNDLTKLGGKTKWQKKKTY